MTDLYFGGRCPEVGATYAPKKPGPKKQPRTVLEVDRGIVRYIVNGRKATCWCSTWLNWAGEKIGGLP